MALTVVLGLVSAGSAAAGSLITSKEIKDNTIRSRDIHNGTIRSADIKDGGVDYSDLAPAADAQLANDAAQAVSNWEEWSPTYPLADGQWIYSSTTFPANTTIDLNHTYLSGDFSACTQSYSVYFVLSRVDGQGSTVLAYWLGGPGGVVNDAIPTSVASASYSVPAQLGLQGTCVVSGGATTPITFGIRAGFPMAAPTVWREIN